MPMYASGGTVTKKPTGSFPAVCVDVIDAGWFEPSADAKKEGRTDWIRKCKIRFYYEGEVEQLDEETGEPVLDEDGEAVMIEGGFYADLFATLSIAPNSILGKFLEGWRGQQFTELERRKWDVEQVIGHPALINVVESSNAGYYDVKAASKVPKALKGSVPAIPADYVRDQDSEESMASRHPKPNANQQPKAAAAAPKPRPTPAPVPAAQKKVASEEAAPPTKKGKAAAEAFPAALEDDEDDLPF